MPKQWRWQKVYGNDNQNDNIKKSERPKPKFPRGTVVKISGHSIEATNPDKNKFVVHGTGKDRWHDAHWLVPHGEKDSSKGFYHRMDRIHEHEDHKMDQSRKKKPNHMKKNEEEPLATLEHYSPHQGLKQIDPNFAREGVDNSAKQNQLSNKISFFYPKGTEPESIVANRAKSKYTVNLSPEHKIFDSKIHGTDHIQAVKDQNQGAFSMDHFIDRLKEHGFHGFRTDPQGIPMVAMFTPTKIHNEEPYSMAKKENKKVIKVPKKKIIKELKEYADNNDLQKSKNVREQRKKVFGTKSQPGKKSKMREKHMEHIKDFVNRRYGLAMKPSGGKVDTKTGGRRSDNPEIGVDKPDWRSGELEAQANPDAMVHEIGHLDIMPEGIGLEDGQTYMDEQYADVQRKYGYMKQKQSQGEVQPMGVEQLLRRRMGLPANRSSVPIESPDAPPRKAVDTGDIVGTRVQTGKNRQGEPKYGDLIRQSRFVSPENRERVDQIDRKELVYDKEKGWVQPDVYTKEGLKENIDAAINIKARQKAQDKNRKDADTLMRSEKNGLRKFKKA